MKTPKDFLKHPYDSVLGNFEDEVVARNIMVILSRTGNTWRRLTWSEYQSERTKDGGFTASEESHFFKVCESYCSDENGAKSFSPAWKL